MTLVTARDISEVVNKDNVPPAMAAKKVKPPGPAMPWIIPMPTDKTLRDISYSVQARKKARHDD